MVMRASETAPAGVSQHVAFSGVKVNGAICTAVEMLSRGGCGDTPTHRHRTVPTLATHQTHVLLSTATADNCHLNGVVNMLRG